MWINFRYRLSARLFLFAQWVCPCWTRVEILDYDPALDEELNKTLAALNADAGGYDPEE